MATLQPGVRRQRQPVRASPDVRRLVGRVGDRAGDRHGAACARLRQRREPAHPGRAVRRRRHAPERRRGAVGEACRRPVAPARRRPDGAHRPRRAADAGLPRDRRHARRAGRSGRPRAVRVRAAARPSTLRIAHSADLGGFAAIDPVIRRAFDDRIAAIGPVFRTSAAGAPDFTTPTACTRSCAT